MYILQNTQYKKNQNNLKGFPMSEEQIIKEMEEMMQVVQKEKEQMIKMLAVLEAENQENPFPDQTTLSINQ